MKSNEIIRKLKEAIIFETAWMYETMPKTRVHKDQMIEAIKVIWNRSISRADIEGDYQEQCISEEDVKQVCEIWLSKEREKN